MKADRLLALFEPISEASDAIPRLRRFILDLAVRGKLVKQDPEDEPAEEQLARIIEAKILLGRRERTNKKKRSELAVESLDSSLPLRWTTAPLADLVTVLNGRAYKQSELLDAGTPVLRVGNLFTSNKWYYSDLELEDDKYCHDGDLIFAWSASFGPFIWNGGRAIYHYHIWKLPLHSPENLSRDYLYLYLLNKTDEIKASGHGISMVHMTKEKMERLEVPLPPLAEQHRIVAKVDELMALCDQLETARQQREQCREHLVAASLQRFNQPIDEPEAFRNDARFTLQVLPSITTTPAQIKQLRQTILNLAVRGKLVEQDPEDEPAIITITGALLAAADSPRKKGRRKASWSPPTENENQELPAGWHLFSLSELVDPASPLSYGVLVPGDNVPDGIPFVRAQDLMLKDHPASPGKRIAQEIDGKYKRTQLTGGEILICVVGSIGKIGIVPEHWSGANIARAVARLKLIPEVSTAYMLLALQSGMIQGFFKDSTRTLAQPTLNISLIEVAPIPLPPLAEQHRIVANVDELMALCYQLEQQLSQAEQSRRVLLEAVLQEALAGPEPVLQSLARP